MEALWGKVWVDTENDVEKKKSSPCDKYFRIAFVFGDKSVKSIEESDLPTTLIEEIKSAKKYMEGRGLRIEVKKKKQIEDIIKLTAIKVNN